VNARRSRFDRLPRRSLAALGALFIAAIVAFAAWDTWRSYEQAVATTSRELQSQSRVIAEQTARSIQAVDVVLRYLVGQWNAGHLQRMDARQLHLYLKEQAVGLVQIQTLIVYDTKGIARAVSVLPPERMPLIDVGADPPFRAMQEGRETGLMVAAATRHPASRQWLVPLGRRLLNADGSFAGAVGAAGRVEYFQQFYGAAFPEPGVRIALLHRNGTLMARHPRADKMLGQHVTDVQALLPAAGAEPVPTRGLSPVDGVDRFAVVRPVPDYPLVVVVTRDAAAALAAWREAAVSSALRTLALAALAALLLWLAMRQLRRLDATRRSVEISQERYALATAGADDGIWDWDLAAGTAFESHRAREIQGLPPAAAETQPLAELQGALQVHPDDAARRHDALQAHLDGRTPAYEVEYRVRPRTGGWRWIRVRALCIRDAEGRPTRIAGSVSDIDERKRIEVDLRESEERFAVAVDGSDDGIWDWNYVSGVAYNSPRARQILGAPPGADRMTIDAWSALMHRHLHPDDGPRRDAAIAEHLAGRTPAYALEYRVKAGDGYRWIRVHGLAMRDAGGRALRMAGSVSDIDDRKRAEEALRRSEERYQLAVEGSNEGLWDWDLKSDLLFLSPRAQALTFLEPGEPLRPRPHWIAMTRYHPDDVAPVRHAIARHLRGETPFFTVEYRVQHHSGTWHWYRQRGVALRDAGGAPYRMAGSMEDITARKNAEAERERLETQLRQAQKLEAIGTLAGGIAHDFNNILSAILGYGELAQKDAPEGTPLRRHVDAALAAGARAKALVERILAFSRSGMGERVPVHVQSVVAEALDAVAASLPPGIHLVRMLAAGDAGLLGDPTQIHQVVMNLCTNAVQAMRGSGTLKVGIDVVDLDAPRIVTTATLPPGSYLRLAVADTGSGIAPAVLDRIFDPFFTTKEVGVGTGLGLSLVHGIVGDLGGGIAVDSPPGEGAVFVVWLPARAYVAPPAVLAEPVAGGNGETVLLVDDEEALVRLGEETLAELGYEPVGFSSSTAALAALRADPARFDAVLSDESMPGLTGSELAREARALRPGLPVVLMSGFVSPALLARAREAGVAEVVGKPLVAGDIARCLANALRGLRAAA
jgi:PAS domain S-box-containing protein